MPTNNTPPDLGVSHDDTLREPKGRFQEVVRRLADAAMSVTHHDIDSGEPEAVHEIQSMERLFTNILRGKLKP